MRSGEQPTDTGFTANVGNLPATYLVLNKPRAGDWTIVPNPGSPAIAQVQTAGGYKEATVRGRVTGKGRKRTITYRIRNLGHGQRVQFVERGRFGSNIVGSTTKRRGRLRFTIADARGGRRRVIALVQKDGLHTGRKTIGTYRAPGRSGPASRAVCARGGRARRSSSRGGRRAGRSATPSRCAAVTEPRSDASWDGRRARCASTASAATSG